MHPRHELKISTIVHLGILILLIVGPIIFPGRYRYKRATVHTVQLVNIPAVKPQKVSPAPEPVTKKAVQKPVAKPKTTPQQKKITTPTLEEKLSKRLETLDLKEPEVESTPQLDIGISSPSNFPFQYYLDIIHDKIATSWQEPQMVLDKRYTAIVTFTILKDGSIQGIYTKKGSGVSDFDQSGIRAIELARPFPPLPQGYAHSQLTVNVAFNLE